MELSKETKDWFISIIAVIVISLILRSYVFARVDVDGPSMMPTIHDKDIIFIERVSIFTHNIKRGQIITFDSKNETNDIYIKRVIAVEGDEVEIKDGKVFLNGSELKEEYINTATTSRPGSFLPDNEKYTVENGYVFVLGDNRINSIDSRVLGPISVKEINGRALIRVFPFNSIKIF